MRNPNEFYSRPRGSRVPSATPKVCYRNWEAPDRCGAGTRGRERGGGETPTPPSLIESDPGNVGLGRRPLLVWIL